MKTVRAGIIGGAGYTGGELLRLLLFHPFVTIEYVHSNSHAGSPIHAVHTDLLGETDLIFSSSVSVDTDVIFLCGAHGSSSKFLEDYNLPDNLVVIDLSNEFRNKPGNTSGNREFVYGLPELNRKSLQSARSIANPGCFATGITLALLPLAAAGLLTNDIHINATTGSTGAGQSLSATSHFSWRNNNLSAYKTFEHQHQQEIGQSLNQLQSGFSGELCFIPQRGSFTRGIFTTAYLESALSEEELIALYREFYSVHPFVRIASTEIDLKQVVNTNRCFIHIQKKGNKTLITSVIDNLLKGASGQAVQNMNLIFGLEETAGLQLKPSAF